MQHNPRLPLLAGFITSLLWAFAFPASRVAVEHFAVEQVVVLRYFVACVFYFVLFAIGLYRLPKWRDLPWIILLSLAGITIYQLCFVFALSRVTAGAAAMVIAANPVVVSLLAHWFLHEKLPRIAWLGIGVSLSGVAMIAWVQGAGGELAGFIALLIAVVTMAAYFVFQKPFSKIYSPLGMVSYTSFLGLVPLAFLLPEAFAATRSAPFDALLAIAAMGIFSSGIGFLLWFYALAHAPAGIISSFVFLQPVFATLLAWLWLGELPRLPIFIGGAIVLVGVGLIFKPQFTRSRT